MNRLKYFRTACRPSENRNVTRVPTRNSPQRNIVSSPLGAQTTLSQIFSLFESKNSIFLPSWQDIMTKGPPFWNWAPRSNAYVDLKPLCCPFKLQRLRQHLVGKVAWCAGRNTTRAPVRVLKFARLHRCLLWPYVTRSYAIWYIHMYIYLHIHFICHMSNVIYQNLKSHII